MQWILVADAARAQLLERSGEAGLSAVESFAHPSSRLAGSRLGRDRAGWTRSDARPGGAALSPRQEPHAREKERFAQQLSEYLEQAAEHGRFDQLTVFAAPRFLGELRDAFGPATLRRIHALRDTSLSHLAPADLARRLEGELQGVS